MDMAFHSDGCTELVGNQGDGTITVADLEQAVVRRTILAGDGVETLCLCAGPKTLTMEGCRLQLVSWSISEKYIFATVRF